MSRSRHVALALATVVLAACAAPPASPPVETGTAPPRDGVFIHLSHGPEDAHRVLMALRMAEMMAADRDVLVYFDVNGIGAVVADAPDLELAPFPPLKAQLEKLVALGVPLYACPGCLEAAGRTQEDLAPGIQVANKDAFFSFTEGRILTLDY